MYCHYPWSSIRFNYVGNERGMSVNKEIQMYVAPRQTVMSEEHEYRKMLL